jgi:hypothetical protein
MGSRSGFRWVVAIVVVLCVVALIAWRRNGPGVGGRVPDESGSIEHVAVYGSPRFPLLVAEGDLR